MTEQLKPADVALLARVLGHEIEPELVRTLGPSTLAAIIQAARSEGPHPEQIAENANCSSPGQLLAESASYSGSGKMTADHVPRAEKVVPHPESGEEARKAAFASVPVEPEALRTSIEELDAWNEAGLPLDEIKDWGSFGEAVSLCLHELKRLTARPVPGVSREGVACAAWTLICSSETEFFGDNHGYWAKAKAMQDAGYTSAAELVARCYAFADALLSRGEG